MKAFELAVDSRREADHESVGEMVSDEVGYVSTVMLDMAKDDHQTISRRRADGFVQLADSYLDRGPRSLGSAERYQVVVHVSAESLQTGGTGRAEHGTWGQFRHRNRQATELRWFSRGGCRRPRK